MLLRKGRLFRERLAAILSFMSCSSFFTRAPFYWPVLSWRPVWSASIVKSDCDRGRSLIRNPNGSNVLSFACYVLKTRISCAQGWNFLPFGFVEVLAVRMLNVTYD